jgi:hypothetical protein
MATPGRPEGDRPKYKTRFAGDAFRREGNPDDGPDLRRLASTIGWKQNPSSNVASELSR